MTCHEKQKAMPINWSGRNEMSGGASSEEIRLDLHPLPPHNSLRVKMTQPLGDS
jgi:hypothetical protein